MKALILHPGLNPRTEEVIGYEWDFEKGILTGAIRIAEGFKSVVIAVGQFEIITEE